MSWIEVRATFVPLPDDASPIIDRYLAVGIENTMVDDGVVVGCLTDVEGAEAKVAALREDLLALGASEVTSGPYEETDWEEAWKRFFHPRRIGRRFVVAPSWELPEREDGDHLIVLDPGQAFGTGDHPTTRLCLELLEETDVDGKRVLDLGTGSGILAIGATMLGAASVLATDLDPTAVEVTRENAVRNGVSFETLVGDGTASLDPGSARPGAWQDDELPLSGESVPHEDAPRTERRFDVVVSNIISAVLIRLAPSVRAILEPGGRWIVSGIIEDNWSAVRAAAEGVGFTLRAERHEDGWVAARFSR